MGQGSKVCTMQQAIGRYVRDGASIVMGCGLESFIPFAAGHEIIRQGKRDLTLIGPISDILFDQLIGAGCVRRVIAAWVGNVSAGLAHNFRRAVEEGLPHPLEVVDHTNFTVALALKAAALGVPYLPTKTALGTDIVKDRSSFREVACPFSGEKLLAVRALEPDLAIVQAQRSDPQGNAHVWGNLGILTEAINASKEVILVCEEVVDKETISSDPNRTVVPGFLVSQVVWEPWGAHPSPVQGYYNRDHEFYREYHQRSRTRQGFLDWLEEWVLGVSDRAQYLKRLSPQRIEALRVKQSRPAALADFGF